MSNTAVQSEPPAETAASEAHVVLLINFLSPSLMPVCLEFAKLVDRLTILSSVAMESNRQWEVDWGELNVVVQKTRTITWNPRHPSGYREINYIHVPMDTLSQLKRLQPDVVVSIEMGARSALSSLYQRRHPQCAHVIGVFASRRHEEGRGRIRRMFRRKLLPRADTVTYNGPECRQLLMELGADEDQLSPWYYAADPRKPYRGELLPHTNQNQLKLLTVGQLSERKGVLLAGKQLSRWASENPAVNMEWNLLGTGPHESAIRGLDLPPNMRVNLHGHSGHDTLREHYRDSDLLLFPTLCDEWGLVVDEALFSGLPVIGSCHAQASTTLIRDEFNGLVYDPEQEDSLAAAMNRYVALPADGIENMRTAARTSVQSRTPETSADQLLSAVSHAIQRRRGL